MLTRRSAPMVRRRRLLSRRSARSRKGTPAATMATVLRRARGDSHKKSHVTNASVTFARLQCRKKVEYERILNNSARLGSRKSIKNGLRKLEKKFFNELKLVKKSKRSQSGNASNSGNELDSSNDTNTGLLIEQSLSPWGQRNEIFCRCQRNAD